MRPPKRGNPHWRDGGFGYSSEKAELGRLREEDSTTPTPLPFRAVHLPLALHALAIRDTTGIMQALLVKAWAYHARVALGCRP